MMSKHLSTDIRWQQRFSNYQKALAQLTKFIAKNDLNELEEQGLIQSFEYTHELAWKTLKDFLEHSGNAEIFGSKDTTRLAFKLSLIEDGEGWMLMIQDRNQTSHTYNIETARAIVDHIRQRYFLLFQQLETQLKALHNAA
ncbi:nucleotidyltransferase substrate binding protein [Methylotenera sp. L2L1]|uniref:nucleotidyltransferase substrate binding protein n=1 Tax=Methylotenera sp. L2L1 TaxID=1502770 RepID=UPI000B0015CE|nr:nucleotidyltransferase substrate binding protein [Methylotenera sp. L2L1]